MQLLTISIFLTIKGSFLTITLYSHMQIRQLLTCKLFLSSIWGRERTHNLQLLSLIHYGANVIDRHLSSHVITQACSLCDWRWNERLSFALDLVNASPSHRRWHVLVLIQSSVQKGYLPIYQWHTKTKRLSVRLPGCQQHFRHVSVGNTKVCKNLQ